MNYSLGFVVGAVVGLAIVAVAILILKKKNNGPHVYDERQAAARGKAFKNGFFALLIYMFLVEIVLEYGFCIRFAEDPVTAFIGICVGVLVFAITCICSDAYVALNEKPRSFVPLFGFIFLLNVVITVGNHSAGRPIVQNGILSFSAMNLICAVMVAVILVVFGVHTLRLKKTEGQAEE